MNYFWCKLLIDTFTKKVYNFSKQLMLKGSV